jgi:hypothetical protein
MRLFGTARRRGRAAGLLVTGLLALLLAPSVPADVVIVSDHVSASSTADGFTNAHSVNGAGNLSTSSSSSAFGMASNGSSASVSLSGTPGGTQTLSIHAATTGFANALGAATNSSNSSSGSANASGTLSLTPVNSLLTEYRVTVLGSDSNSSSATSAFNWNGSSGSAQNADSLSLSGNGFLMAGAANTSSSSSDGFGGGTDTGGFTLGSEVSRAGLFTFDASTLGKSSASSNAAFFGFADPGSGSNSGSLNFQLQFEPIPEPGTFTVLALGALGLAGIGWVRRFRKGAAL